MRTGMKLELHFQTQVAAEEDRLSREIICGMAGALASVVDNLPAAAVNVVICSEEFIRRLNRQFREKDSVTDVLSFPLEGLEEDEVWGEIYICWARVQEQSKELGHSWQRELAYLLAHGLLHLLGYDHGDEPNHEMRQLEESVLAEIGLGR